MKSILKSVLVMVVSLSLLFLLYVVARPYVMGGGGGVLVSSAGHESSAARRDPAAECGELAPEDPYVDDEEEAGRALAACREAAKLAPDDAETLYRQGASALQADLLDEAVESLRKAEQLGHCGALYYLGDAAWYSDGDAERAEDYYRRGAACGDKRAAGELFSAEKFKHSSHGELLEALYNSDIPKLNNVRFATAPYVEGIYAALSEQYLGPDFDPCWTSRHYRGGEIQYGLTAAMKGDGSNFLEDMAYEKALPVAFQVLVPGQGTRALEEFREAERKAGYADLIRVVQASRCDALLPYKIVKGIEAYAKAKKSLFEVVREGAPHIRSQEDLLNWLRQKKQEGAPDAIATQ